MPGQVTIAINALFSFLRRMFLILAFLPFLPQGARSTITGGEWYIETQPSLPCRNSVETSCHISCMTNNSAFWEELGIGAAWHNQLAINRPGCILFSFKILFTYIYIYIMWRVSLECNLRDLNVVCTQRCAVSSRTERNYWKWRSKWLRLVLE